MEIMDLSQCRYTENQLTVTNILILISITQYNTNDLLVNNTLLGRAVEIPSSIKGKHKT